jgi:probable rRNA maturation factor
MGDEPPSPTAGPRVVTGDDQDDAVVDVDGLAQLARAVLGGEGVPVDAEVNLLFVDEAAIAELNETHLGGRGSTDVLSFPIDGPSLGLAGDAGAVGAAPPSGVMVGDVVICPAVARRNAEGQGTTLDQELRLVVVHGALHLLGHDHADEGGAEAMRARELRYAGRAGATAPEAAR